MCWIITLYILNLHNFYFNCISLKLEKKKLYAKKKMQYMKTVQIPGFEFFKIWDADFKGTTMPGPQEVTLNNPVRTLSPFQFFRLSRRKHLLGACDILPLYYLLINIFNR